MFEFLKKGISTSIAIGIILILAIFVGGVTYWQYQEMQKEELGGVEISVPEKEEAPVAEEKIEEEKEISEEPKLREPLPWLHVDGNKIVDENGNKIILRGVAIEDPYWTRHAPHAPWFRSHNLTEKDFAELSENWQVNVIRIPFHPDLWEHDPNYTENYLDPVVSWGRKYGVYILLGWHAHGNPITNEVEPTGWGSNSPWHGNPYNPNLDLAVKMWHEVAERYKNDSWVIYSIFNEPSYISWDEWRPVAEQLIDVVRSHNPKALILVPGVAWGYDLSKAGENPIQRDNIVYEVHPYPGQTIYHGPWETYFGYLSSTYPVFVGEWGFEPGSSEENLNSTSKDYGRPLLDYMDNKGMSWTTWVWSPEWTPRMLQDWNYTPTEFGQLVKDALK